MKYKVMFAFLLTMLMICSGFVSGVSPMENTGRFIKLACAHPTPISSGDTTTVHVWIFGTGIVLWKLKFIAPGYETYETPISNAVSKIVTYDYYNVQSSMTIEVELYVSEDSEWILTDSADVIVTVGGTVVASLLSSSQYYHGPFYPDEYGNVEGPISKIKCLNSGTVRGNMYFRLSRHPETPDETHIDGFFPDIKPYEVKECDIILLDIVTEDDLIDGIVLPFGIKLWGVTESEPSWDNSVKTHQWNLYIGQNLPPNPPSIPSGATSGQVNTPYTFSASTDDPETHDIFYWFDWDDGTNSGWVGPYASGASGSSTHTWVSPGTYNVKAKAKDVYGDIYGSIESDWSDPPLIVTITNEAPNTPSIPTGSASGYHGESYSYSTSASDPDSQKVKYEFDWGDGTSDWTGWVGSGESASKEHTWSNPGSYCIKVKAQDESGGESDYSDCFYVTMGNQAPDVPFNPSPSPGDNWVDVECSLSWDCGDPDGDSLSFDVYFGTNSSPPRVLKNHQSFSYSPPGMLDILTTYYWRVVAFDCCDGCDAETSSLVWSFTTRGGYHSPVPSLYDGWLKGNSPDWGTYSDEFVFKVHYYDEDGDPASVASLVVDDVMEFSMNKIGGGSAADADYEARLMGSEFGGGYHEYYFWFEDGTISDGVRFPDVGGWHFTVNYLPDKPALAGPSGGKKNVELSFDAVASDKDGDKIQYWFDWGDGTNTGWTPLEPVSSGTKVTRSHSWGSRGSYTVKVKARDINEDESDWDSITVSISTPKSRDKLRVASFFEKLLDSFPLLKLLLSSHPFFNKLQI